MQMHEEKKSPMCCVHCGTPVNEVYVQYSPGNIRLTKCIIVIDLILHKPEAYRHLFFNYPNLNKLDLKMYFCVGKIPCNGLGVIPISVQDWVGSGSTKKGCLGRTLMVRRVTWRGWKHFGFRSTQNGSISVFGGNENTLYDGNRTVINDLNFYRLQY
eukprot:c26250_g1_i2 orf=373-843(+)